jgi:hypothetical protein
MDVLVSLARERHASCPNRSLSWFLLSVYSNSLLFNLTRCQEMRSSRVRYSHIVGFDYYSLDEQDSVSPLLF